MKYLILLLIFLYLTACTFDSSSNLSNKKQNTVNIKNNNVLINENAKFDNFKKEVLDYSNKEGYPDITK